MRQEASLRDVAKVGVEFLTKRELLRGNATERKETTQVSVAEQLKELALEFSKWSGKKQPLEVVVDITDVEPKEEEFSFDETEDDEDKET